MKRTITMPDGSTADAAFTMPDDTMSPAVLPGQVVLLEEALPAQGGCGLFVVDGQTLVRQCCQDDCGNLYLLCVNRAYRARDIMLSAEDAQKTVCAGRLLLDREPPLPLD